MPPVTGTSTSASSSSRRAMVPAVDVVPDDSHWSTLPDVWLIGRNGL